MYSTPYSVVGLFSHLLPNPEANEICLAAATRLHINPHKSTSQVTVLTGGMCSTPVHPRITALVGRAYP